MSLLTICQNVARETGFLPPTTIIGNNNQDARRLLQCATTTGTVLSRKNWTSLVKEYTFSTSATAAYALPSDFKALVDTTAWNRTTYEKMYGPINPQDWQELKSGLTVTGVVDSFRIKALAQNKNLYIDPTPTTAETIAYEYRSTSWIYDSIGDAYRTAFTLDTETSLIDESLIELGTKWRWLNALGQSYFEEKEEFDHQVEIAYAEDGSARELRLGSYPRKIVAVTPDTGFGP